MNKTALGIYGTHRNIFGRTDLHVQSYQKIYLKTQVYLSILSIVDEGLE